MKINKCESVKNIEIYLQSFTFMALNTLKKLRRIQHFFIYSFKW